MSIERFHGSRIPAFDFAREAFALADELTADEVHSRQAPWMKAFIEEVLPLATFAKCWEVPGRQVAITYFGGDHPYDAEVHVAGTSVERRFCDPLYHVELTSAISEHDHYEREALWRHGSVFLGDPEISPDRPKHRPGRKIVSRATARDGDAEVTDLQQWVSSAIVKKSASAYPAPCILLVRAEPDRNLNIVEWASVARSVYAAAITSHFKSVFLVHTSTGVAFEL